MVLTGGEIIKMINPKPFFRNIRVEKEICVPESFNTNISHKVLTTQKPL